MIIGIMKTVATILLSICVSGRTLLLLSDDEGYTMESKKLAHINSVDTVNIRQEDSC